MTQHNTTKNNTAQHNTIQHNTSHSSAFTCKCNCNFVLRALAGEISISSSSAYLDVATMTETNAVKVLSTYVLMIMICIKSYQHPIWPSYHSIPKFHQPGIFFSPPCGLPVWPYSWTQFRPASAICVIFSFQEGRKCCIFSHKNAAFFEQTTKRNVIRTIWITMIWYSPYSLDVWLLVFFP